MNLVTITAPMAAYSKHEPLSALAIAGIAFVLILALAFFLRK